MATTYEKYLECNIIQDVLFKEQADNMTQLNAYEMRLNALNLNTNTSDEARNAVVAKINEINDKISDIAKNIAAVSAARSTILNTMVSEIGVDSSDFNYTF